jgi:hypothetical protein
MTLSKEKNLSDFKKEAGLEFVEAYFIRAFVKLMRRQELASLSNWLER